MEKTLEFESPRLLADTFCNRQENLDLAELKFGVRIVSRDSWIRFEGDEPKVELAAKFFKTLGEARRQGMRIGQGDFRNMLSRAADGRMKEIAAVFENPLVINLKRKSIVPKNINQKKE